MYKIIRDAEKLNFMKDAYKSVFAISMFHICIIQTGAKHAWAQMYRIFFGSWFVKENRSASNKCVQATDSLHFISLHPKSKHRPFNAIGVRVANV